MKCKMGYELPKVPEKQHKIFHSSTKMTPIKASIEVEVCRNIKDIREKTKQSLKRRYTKDKVGYVKPSLKEILQRKKNAITQK